jgi:hypothetical protein
VQLLIAQQTPANGLNLKTSLFLKMLIVVLLLLAAFLYWHSIHKRKNYPRGPTPLPFFGNALTLKKYHGDLDKIFIKWQAEFGDIYTVWVSF